MSNVERELPFNGQEGAKSELELRPFENTVIALDVDGVLVKPLAYRQAISSTITFFGEKLGVDPAEFMIDDKNSAPGRNMSQFEAEGIHDPWDVSAIIVSLMKLKKASINVSNDDVLETFRKNASPQSHPPDITLQWLQEKYGNVILEVMKDIAVTLSETRNPFSNEVTSVFQEYVLGKETFELTYGRKSQTGAEESLIKTKDESLVDEAARKEIERISQEGGMVVIYTGRPGLPPPDAERKEGDGYAPEAELAIERSGVKAIGIVSMGSMEWLGRETGTPVEDLTKPNPTQALAVILAAIRGKVDKHVLLDAYEWAVKGIKPQDAKTLAEREKLKLVVVEDSPSGVRAFINAKKIIEKEGVNVSLTAVGVHDVSFEKHMAFTRLGEDKSIDTVDTNSGVREGIIRYSFQGRAETES